MSVIKSDGIVGFRALCAVELAPYVGTLKLQIRGKQRGWPAGGGGGGGEGGGGGGGGGGGWVINFNKRGKHLLPGSSRLDHQLPTRQ